MRHVRLCAAAAIVLATLAGCVGPNAYVSVDLDRPLPPRTVARYEREWRDLGRPPGRTLLEHSNWWPLGLLLYHRDASVVRMPGSSGPTYTITSGTGLGPLALIYAGQTMATFDASGRRLSGMKMHNLFLMHLAMVHESDVLLANGVRERMTTYNLFMHLVNISTMHGRTYVSLLTVPNPLGVALAAGAPAGRRHAAGDAGPP